MADKGLRAPCVAVRNLQRVLFLGAGISILAGGIIAPLQAASASKVNTDRGKITTLQQKIAAEGARAERLVSRYDRVQANAEAIQARLKVIDRQIARDRAATARTASVLRRIAVQAYVSGGSLGSASSFLQAPSSRADVISVYAGVVATRLNATTTTYQLQEHRTKVASATLRKEQSAAEATLKHLAPAKAAADAIVADDVALLGSVRGNLHHLLVVAADQRAAAEARQERAFAAKSAARGHMAVTTAAVGTRAATRTRRARPLRTAAQTTTSTTTTAPVQQAAATTTTTPAPPAKPSSSGGYANPLRAVSGLSANRIDQGVDYGGYGPMYAIGDGVVTSTYNGGWPGGTFITYRLTDGPAAGLTVYAAEDLEPSVQIGQTVTSSTVIGQMYVGPTGIETGWADSSLGNTMAMSAGQFGGSNTTAFGYNFSRLLQSLGAPGGIDEGSPSGGLPGGWPQW
ncbi:MAG: hypothetical protein JWM85_1203 [Acidimicrobiaceae bacterium]|nr:hypothetical protein [Acidimicrobiaceae bacterium]